jgi:hypothetical protein
MIIVRDTVDHNLGFHRAAVLIASLHIDCKHSVCWQ